MIHKRLRVAIVVLALVLAQLGRSPTTVRALTLTVNTTSDLSGTGCMTTPQCSLRRAINEANANPGPDIIQFNIPGTDPGCDGAGVCTIQPASELPALTGDGTTIDGYTQPGAAPATKTSTATLKIELDGTNAGSASGLTINSADNVIQGLTINRFDSSGIYLSSSGATGNVIVGNYIGTDVSGAAALGNLSGVKTGLGASNNIIGGDMAEERNVISGNAGDGVFIGDSGTTGNTVSGNYIGTDAGGAASLGNTWDGVHICDGAQNNTIGGNTPGEQNVIAGNGMHGVHVSGSGTMSNTMLGNTIGTDANGTAALGNAVYGVYVDAGVQYTVIGGSNATSGGDCTGACNVISDNGSSGVMISGSGTMSNTVSGNYIGTDVSGTAALGNSSYGVTIEAEARYNAIGGDTAGERNIISSNGSYGVYIRDSGTTGNTVSGNYIGTDASGTADLGNASRGITIYGAQNNTIGGDTAGERNVISGNGPYGVYISSSGTMSNTVSGNYIGTDASGTAALSNSEYGVFIGEGAQYNVIGGDTEGERNVISGNGSYGVYIAGSGTMSNTVSGNFIGTDANGTSDLGNIYEGIWIIDGAQHNVIGGDTPGERNVISGNDGYGIYIGYSGTTDNTVSGNYIGTDVNGTSDLGNTLDGVWIDYGAQHNVIGGDTPGERNVISGNDGYGIYIGYSGTMSNTVSGNYIGTDASGTAVLSNTLSGVRINIGAQHNIIGGDTPGERNVISGNGSYGVYIAGSGTMNNTVSGNFIGTDVNGTAVLSNTLSGVRISNGAQYNVIGGDTEDEQNIISGNGEHGVYIDDSDTMSNTVSGNFIGTDAGGTAALGNTWIGVYIYDGAQNNTVGPNNVIACNDNDGVEVNGSSTSGNTITQNSIFSNAMGIDLVSGANGNIAAPTITAAAGTSIIDVTGTVCAGCTVELFANDDTDGEGETFVGDTIADGSGVFTVTVPAGSISAKPYLTATATDVVSGTSEFSGVHLFLAPRVYLPLVLRNSP